MSVKELSINGKVIKTMSIEDKIIYKKKTNGRSITLTTGDFVTTSGSGSFANYENGIQMNAVRDIYYKNQLVTTDKWKMTFDYFASTNNRQRIGFVTVKDGTVTTKEWISRDNSQTRIFDFDQYITNVMTAGQKKIEIERDGNNFRIKYGDYEYTKSDWEQPIDIRPRFNKWQDGYQRVTNFKIYE